MIERLYWLLTFSPHCGVPVLFLRQLFCLDTDPPGSLLPTTRLKNHIFSSSSLNLLFQSNSFDLAVLKWGWNEIYHFCSVKKSRDENGQNFSSQHEHCQMTSLVWLKFDCFLCANRRRSPSRSSAFCVLIFLEVTWMAAVATSWTWRRWLEVLPGQTCLNRRTTRCPG